MATVAIRGEQPRTRHLPGEEGIWLFILGDMMVFALFFLTFVYYRGTDVATYVAAQKGLNEGLGLLNTLFLLTSSWFVALAVRGMRAGGGARTPWLIAAAMLCGLAFVVVKFIEYREKFAAGITVLTNEFFMFYFMFTGIHLIHVLIGLGVLTYLLLLSRKPLPAAGDISAFESGAAFWHLVDLLWVVLFALLYLVR
ncbi:cytochrome c oxidase subunit 3 family protein [soil metagenome]